MGNDFFRQEYFNCCLVILLYCWWDCYGVINWYIEVYDIILFSTSVYISPVYVLELLLYSSDFFLALQSMTLSLKISAVDVTEHLSERSLAWFSSQYLWRKLEYFWVLLISTSPDLNKHWCGIPLFMYFVSLNTW